jgi:hypothetical protein
MFPTKPLVDLLKFASQPQAQGKVATVACGDHTFAQCPAYFEGCFDYSPMVCGGANPMTPPGVPAWQPAKQAPAELWRDVPAANIKSSLPLETQLCVRRACDALEATQASLCYCQGTADDPSTCDSPLGLAQPLAMLAHAACTSAR